MSSKHGRSPKAVAQQIISILEGSDPISHPCLSGLKGTPKVIQQPQSRTLRGWSHGTLRLLSGRLGSLMQDHAGEAAHTNAYFAVGD